MRRKEKATYIVFLVEDEEITDLAKPLQVDFVSHKRSSGPHD